jgi:uncharacterized integral membrane protein
VIEVKDRAMLRKIVTALVLIPLAVLLISFAVANRQAVTVSFDPFDPSSPAFSVALPLYLLILLLIIVGVIVGGAAAWLRQGKWRGRARRAESQTRGLRAENEELKRREGTLPGAPTRVEQAPRLTIPPPAA